MASGGGVSLTGGAGPIDGPGHRIQTGTRDSLPVSYLVVNRDDPPRLPLVVECLASSPIPQQPPGVIAPARDLRTGQAAMFRAYTVKGTTTTAAM